MYHYSQGCNIDWFNETNTQSKKDVVEWNRKYKKGQNKTEIKENNKVDNNKSIMKYQEKNSKNGTCFDPNNFQYCQCFIVNVNGINKLLRNWLNNYNNLIVLPNWIFIRLFCQ